jgi:hypothetical protein
VQHLLRRRGGRGLPAMHGGGRVHASSTRRRYRPRARAGPQARRCTLLPPQQRGRTHAPLSSLLRHWQRRELARRGPLSRGPITSRALPPSRSTLPAVQIDSRRASSNRSPPRSPPRAGATRNLAPAA